MEKTLLLTAWMTPHRVLDWRDAVCLVLRDKVDVLEAYAGMVRSPSVELPLPAVIRLRVGHRQRVTKVRFSRLNLFLRDRFRCQYCGRQTPPWELTQDHVLPRCRGGRSTWENVVAACRSCNAHKGSRTPDEAGLTLACVPRRPKTLPLLGPRLGATLPSEWRSYVGGMGTPALR